MAAGHQRKQSTLHPPTLMTPHLSFTVTALTFALVIGALHLPTGLCVLALSAVVHVVCILQRPH
jgi:hypothetical protein